MRFFITLTIVITALSLLALFFIVEFTVPKNLNGDLISINLVYFFLALFLSLCGITTLVLYWLSSLRLKGKREGSIEAVHRPRVVFKRSARQAILISLSITGILVLQSLGFANPLNFILIVSAAVLIEVYFFGH